MFTCLEIEAIPTGHQLKVIDGIMYLNMMGNKRIDVDMTSLLALYLYAYLHNNEHKSNF